MSIVQGPFSIAPCQTLALRFANFASLYGRLRASPPRTESFPPPRKLSQGRRKIGFLKCLQGGLILPLAACGVATRCCSPHAFTRPPEGGGGVSKLTCTPPRAPSRLSPAPSGTTARGATHGCTDSTRHHADTAPWLAPARHAASRRCRGTLAAPCDSAAHCWTWGSAAPTGIPPP